jgi:putative transposase
MNRGDRREPIYADDQDRLPFLDTLAEACGKTDWQVHAWCLMSNLFHLVSETPRGNLVHGMQWLLGVYTSGSSVYGGGDARRFPAAASKPERAKQ